MIHPFCFKKDPPCMRTATRIVIAAGENRGLGRRGPAIVTLVCDDHFQEVCNETRERDEPFVWSRCEWQDA